MKIIFSLIILFSCMSCDSEYIVYELNNDSCHLSYKLSYNTVYNRFIIVDNFDLPDNLKNKIVQIPEIVYFVKSATNIEITLVKLNTDQLKRTGQQIIDIINEHIYQECIIV